MIHKPGSTQISLDFQEHPPTKVIQISKGLPWIEVAKDAPYFVTENGDDWAPIGQNDAITWPELRGVFRRKDMATAEIYFKLLSQHGVTCLRLMLEYCQGENRYVEKPAGHFQPNMVRLWDDIFALAEKYRLRILLTPYDTFWMWIRWSHHPYKKSNGGPCARRTQWLLDAGTRNFIKQRLAFATERWGGSGALFAWDIWNEIHPAHAGDSVACFSDFVEDIASFLRQTEVRLHGRAHPQTVSVFGPVLQSNPDAADCAFRHPSLDFASIHFYESNTIDNPRNTVDAAISTGRLTREAIAHTKSNRPFFDSEHGPIHAFKDKHKTLSEPFDDEYFRHMQWAHFASGGAGGGMRWPNRNPHSLTLGMRRAQQALARFQSLMNWQQFRRKNLNDEILISEKSIVAFGCGDGRQAVIWLLRTNNLDKKGMLMRSAESNQAVAKIPGLEPGRFHVTIWNTELGIALTKFEVVHGMEEYFTLQPLNVVTDLAVAVRRIGV
jgi:hypothetical protein